MKNTHGGLLLLIKLQNNTCDFTKSNTRPWVFFSFFKLYNWYQIAQSLSFLMFFPAVKAHGSHTIRFNLVAITHLYYVQFKDRKDDS